MKPTWQRLIFAAPFLLALNFAVCVYTVLSEKERKFYFYFKSPFLCSIYNLLCPTPFFYSRSLNVRKHV